MIAIINYDAGNLASVSNALERLQANFRITNKTRELDAADAVIFPGVGHAKPAMESLQRNGLDRWIQQTSKPLLGICLGMQLFFESTEEGGGTNGLGLLPGKLKRFKSRYEKVPHMGWNTCRIMNNHPLLEDIRNDEYFYFDHSFFAPLGDFMLSSCNYISDFAAIVARDNVMGTQFHPEKSGAAGQQLLKNFLAMSGNTSPPQ